MDGVEEGMVRGPYPPPRNRPEKVKTKGIEKGIESSADPEIDVVRKRRLHSSDIHRVAELSKTRAQSIEKS
eukprot:30376-Eustigmatos_ZCMA.PRE.1